MRLQLDVVLKVTGKIREAHAASHFADANAAIVNLTE